jgi:TetR/AcrR family transcriptional regulator, mexJK operon transcriptional repressor
LACKQHFWLAKNKTILYRLYTGFQPPDKENFGMSNEGIEVAERPVRRGGGRPTREEAVRRDARLLEVATTLFMERGFDGTTIDAVAETAGVSKPTVYARYRDKRDLFAAVLRGRIRDWLAPLSAAAEAQATESNPKSAETTLHELSRHMLAQASMPECATLQRILAAQAVQFPELAKLAHEDGWLRGVRGVAILLQQFAARGEIRVGDPELAADLFLNLLLGHSARLAINGIAIDPQFLERRRQGAVELFLNGVRK